MTREEAIQVLTDIKRIRSDEIAKAIDMAIEALSEDISEDGTLKVKVKDGSKVNRVLVWGDNMFGGLYYPDRPNGEWIGREHCQVDEDAYEIATCSHCKAEITLEYPNDNFCPNCGADMQPKGFVADEWYRDTFGENDGK